MLEAVGITGRAHGEEAEADVAEVARFLQEQATIQSEDRPVIVQIRTQVSSLCVQDAGSLPIPQEPSVQ